MKKLFLLASILFVVMLIDTSCSVTKSGNGIQLKVLSYNIHHANPPSKPGFIDVEAIARVIKESGADVVALQEVDVHTERSGKDLDQAAAIGKLTGMHYYFAKGIDFQGGEYGIAVLSRFPFMTTESFPLPMAPESGGEPRVLAIVSVEPVKGQRVYLANTHMDLLPQNRNLQAREIVKTLSALNDPVIFCGDLNAEPESEVIGIFGNALKRSSVTNSFTFPETKPDVEIDYIMFKPEKRFSVINHTVIEETYASDHRPLLVELKLK